ncbi:hypothetical protein FYZ48_07125 [Gimesia chilikensis]|uniref:DUF6985 domain-containing protein n=1 Tax=Gimesia chilikensis TaxID=2605989 RepID=UPI0011ED3295|nr:hypothetical protein [Gimesia chilikensis]KAA0139699.1 hypothetical protein FYZ48_07125 [Gimesia chilikensis]
MSLFSDIKYKSEYEAWLGKVELAGFETCGILWDCDADYLSEAYEKSEPNNGPVLLELQIESADGKPPAKEQEAAFEYLCANEDSIAKAALKYALQQCKSAYYPESLPETKTLQGEKRELRKRLNTLDGFCELVEPNTVTILSEHKNKVAYIAFDFRTSLDYEHGFSVLTHRRKAVNWAGAGERGGGPPATISPEGQDLIKKSIDCEALYLDLVSQVVDLKSAERLAEDIAQVEAESKVLYNETSRLFIPNSPQDQKHSRILSQRFSEFQRIWKKCPEAAKHLNLYLKKCLAWKNSRS